MARSLRLLALLLLGAISFAGSAHAQQEGDGATPVLRILSNPAAFFNQPVTITGNIVRHVDIRGASHAFVLEDDFSTEINIVSTAPAPPVQTRWSIQGLVAIGPNGGNAYIVESARRRHAPSASVITTTISSESPLEGVASGRSEAPSAAMASEAMPSAAVVQAPAPAAPSSDPNVIFVILLAILLIAFLAWWITTSRKSAPVAAGAYSGPPVMTGSYSPPAPAPTPAPSMQAALEDDYFAGRTIRFAVPDASDGTLRLLPGRLEVVAGPDKGQEIRFVHPGGESPEITFGRSTGAKFAHVQLTAPTVSRKHAAMRFEAGQWKIVNFSETNPLRVNGSPLTGVGQVQSISDGDVIEFGEVSLAFRAL